MTVDLKKLYDSEKTTGTVKIPGSKEFFYTPEYTDKPNPYIEILRGPYFWVYTIPLAIIVSCVIPVYGLGIGMIILFLSFCWMCVHCYPGRRWDGSYYRRWYY